MSGMKACQVSSDRAQEWFEEIVEPTVAEFLEQPDSKRKGCLAILAVASMTEHYFHARYGFHVTGESRKQFGPKLAKFKETIRDYKNGTGVGPIGMVADLANATKHVISKNGIDHEGMEAKPLNVCGVMRFGWRLWAVQWPHSLRCASIRQTLGSDAPPPPQKPPPQPASKSAIGYLYSRAGRRPMISHASSERALRISTQATQ